MQESRTQNTIRNVSVVLVMQIINALVGLISRTAFVYILGNNYLSLNGLFANILTLLSFAELGIGNAIIFSLYKPIAEKDFQRISAILNLYKKVYRYVTLFVIVLGIGIIPFLGYIITDVSISENLIVIYILYVLNSASTYILAYKKSLIIAEQRNYIIVTIQQIVYIFQVVLQIVFLLFVKNFIVYLIIGIASNLIVNIICDIYANKRYSFLKDYNNAELLLSEKKNIFANVKALFIYKISAAFLNGTDSIIISFLVKTTYVGICSNYSLIINTINTVVMQVCNSIVASIGNHNVTANQYEKEKIFRELNVLCYLIFSVTSICLAVLLNPLIHLWLGEQYVLDSGVVISMVLAYYFTGTNQIASLYRTSMGMFDKAKMIPFFAAIINIFLSLLLGSIYGLEGVFYATSISRIVTFTLFDPAIIYKNGFNTRPTKTYLSFVFRTCVMILVYALTVGVLSLISLYGFYGFIIKTIVAVIFVPVSIISILMFNNDFRDAIRKIYTVVRR